MTIEYKDSKRIVGLSTDSTFDVDATPNTSGVGSDGTTWSRNDTGTVTFSNSRLNVGSDADGSIDGCAYDLGSGYIGDTWTLDYDFRFSTMSAGLGSYHAFMISNTGSSANWSSTSINAIWAKAGAHPSVSSADNMWIGESENSALDSGQDGQVWASGNGGWSSKLNTTFYARLTRVSDTQYKFGLYSDAGRTALLSGTQLVTGTITASAITDLRYISFNNYNGNTTGAVVGYFENIKFYNNTSAVYGEPKSKPTDVQNNSILVEKDTARRYWFSEELAPTYETNFASSSGWTENTTTASDIDIDTANNKVYLNLTHNSSETSVLSRTLPTTSNTAWILRFKVNATSVGTDGSLLVGLSTNASASDTQQRFLGFWFKELNSSALRAVTDDNNNAGGLVGGNNTSGYTGTPSSGTDYYVTVVRDVNDIKVTTRTGSHTGTAVGSGTVTTAVDGTATGLNTLKIMNHKSSTGGAWIGYLYDLEFYNGVTSVTPATWNAPSKTPAEIGDLKVHYDATVGVTASSNSVSAWADQSGNGKTLSSVSNPTRVVAGQNGKDYIDFNSSKSMRASGLSEDAPRPFTMVAVINPRNTSDQTIIRWGQSPYLALYQYPVNTYYISGGSDVGLSDSTLDGSWNAFFMDFKSNADGGTLQINLDTANAVSGDIGNNGTSGSGGNSQPSTLHVGINGTNNNWYANCRYAEIIIFDKVLTAYEKEQLYGHLKTKWGLP